ncbi:GAF domain-containing protein [Marimonas sp. MJW-29]|uniref:GAF domain-containing protein n=1 Tax=Sulfitobacter sediminis TaxID=3234186 RepID=A0ABV3RUZ6_9RHOB
MAQEREAATREVLDVISRSRANEGPVFDVILRSAARLCNAPFADLDMLDEDGLHLREVATLGASERVIPSDRWVWSMKGPHYHVKAVRTGELVHIHDLRKSENYISGNPLTVASVDTEKMRTLLAAPLRTGGKSVGCIVLFRQEVNPFSAEEIALVETFAAQAVIAIENVRQFREVQKRLEREEATRQILGVISQSRDNEKPVFDTILESACRLCDAPLAFLSLVNDEGTHFRVPAHRGATSEMARVWDTQLEPIEGSALMTSKAIRNRLVIQVDDLSSSDLPDTSDHRRAQLAELEKVGTYLVIPLIRGERAIGTINLYRREIRPFPPEQIKLVETFAAQAVIAIENVRRFREVQERLEREKASAEILGVISRSRDAEKPVFDAILDCATRLCGADSATILMANAERTSLTLMATVGARRQSDLGETHSITSGHTSSDAVLTGRPAQITDARDTELYRQGDPIRVELVDEWGLRTSLGVPLLIDNEAIGCITVMRMHEVRPFLESEVALIETFAAQAVIAIENARQFRALQEKTEEVLSLNTSLEKRVDEQVGEIERMGRLKRFLPAAVADTIVTSGSENMLSSHRVLLGVLFCDIRGFTAFCETAEPEETIEVLQTYHEELGKLINSHGAGVDHRMGDGIMVLFNDPLPCDDPAGDAVRLAIAMRARMEELCRTWKRMGYRLGFGIGVSLGYATVGMVGFEGRFDYTASGTAINLASRLCDEADDGEILLSPKAAIAVEDEFQVESRGELSLKGLREPIEVFRLATVSVP